MIQAERELQILNLIEERGSATVRELAERFAVTEVTIRRDLDRMEAQSLLRRTHGGAVSLQVSPLPVATAVNGDQTSEASDVDALIIAPVNNRAAHTLREKAIRNRIPFLAESSPQDGAVYLGPHNYEAGYDLGRWTGEYIRAHFTAPPSVLDITQHNLPNTRERSRGFADGLRDVLGYDATLLSIDGKALYNQSYQVALDALRAEPSLNVIFGINDDALLAGLQACADLGYDLDRMLAVNIGGEGSTIFNALMQRGAFKACVALFPEIVGRMGVDTVCRLWAGATPDEAVYTPHRLLTADTLHKIYRSEKSGWRLRDDALHNLLPEGWMGVHAPADRKRLSLIIHYRTHEWYQNLAAAMDARARELGIQFTAQDVKTDLAAEIRDLRRLIGKLAASYVEDGDTIILDAGSTTAYMAQFLKNRQNLTVITNSLDVIAHLKQQPHINLLVTGGDYDAESNALVGRGSHLLLGEIRANKTFLVAGGLSTGFGMSSLHASETEVRRHMIRAARETIVLADHTVIGVDANNKVCDLGQVNKIITDAGIQAEHSLELTRLGIEVIVAGQVSHRDKKSEEVQGPSTIL